MRVNNFGVNLSESDLNSSRWFQPKCSPLARGDLTVCCDARKLSSIRQRDKRWISGVTPRTSKTPFAKISGEVEGVNGFVSKWLHRSTWGLETSREDLCTAITASQS